MASPQSLADIPQMDCGLTLLHAADDECTAVGSVDQGFSGSGKHFEAPQICCQHDPPQTFLSGFLTSHIVQQSASAASPRCRRKWTGPKPNPEKLVDDWDTLQRGISAWLGSQHLASVTLEVFHPQSDALVGRWDFELYYGTARDGAMWVNTEDIKYHVLKAGRWPSSCDYRVIVSTKPGEPSVAGWSNTTFRSTAGFVRASEPPSTATATLLPAPHTGERSDQRSGCLHEIPQSS